MNDTEINKAPWRSWPQMIDMRDPWETFLGMGVVGLSVLMLININ